MEGGGAGGGGDTVHTHQVARARPQPRQAVVGGGGGEGAGLEAAHHTAVLACLSKRYLPGMTSQHSSTFPTLAVFLSVCLPSYMSVCVHCVHLSLCLTVDRLSWSVTLSANFFTFLYACV